MKLKNTIVENGKTIFGVVTGLAIAGASLMAAKLNSKPESDDYAEEETDSPVVDAEDLSEPSEEESSEE